MNELVDLERDLVEAARKTRDHAYAPYSRFLVGAALRSSSGTIYTGCNIENATYGATLCAERAAIAHMITAGERDLVAIAVFTDASDLAMPCGICRQVMREFGSDVAIVIANPRAFERTTIGELLPRPFVLST